MNELPKTNAKRGFTLLEVLVATLIMAIAVAGLMGAISTSLRNAARLTDHDRAVLLGHQKMDELLIATGLEKGVPFNGTWGPEVTGGSDMGWRARLTPFEVPKGWRRGTAVYGARGIGDLVDEWPPAPFVHAGGLPSRPAHQGRPG